MKILFVASNLSVNSPTSIRILGLADGLSRDRSIDLHILTLAVNRNDLSRNARIHSITEIEGLKYLWCPEWLRKAVRFANRIVYKIKFLRLYSPGWSGLMDRFYKVIVALENQYNFGLIILTVPPHGLLDLLCHDLIASKCIVDLCDPLEQDATTSGKSLFARLIQRRYEVSRLNKSRALLVTNAATLSYYRKRLRKGMPMLILPQGVGADFCGVEKSEETLTTDRALSVIYAGAFYPTLRDPRNFLSACQVLNDPETLIEARIFGGFVYDAELQMSLRSTGLRGVATMEQLPHSDLIREYERADLALFIDNSRGIQTPGKVFELLALGIPVLFIYDNPSSPTFEFIKPAPANWIIVRNDESSILSILQLLLSRPKPPWTSSKKRVNKTTWRDRAEQLADFLRREKLGAH